MQCVTVCCAAGSLIALKCGLHAQLVRAACTLPALQSSLLPQLVSFVSAYNWNDAGQAAWLASLLPDLVDAVQSTEGSSGQPLGNVLACITGDILLRPSCRLVLGLLVSLGPA